MKKRALYRSPAVAILTFGYVAVQAQDVSVEWKNWDWRFISEQRWTMTLHTAATT